MLPCEDCEKYLDAFLDHALDVKESLDVEEHLRSCTSCAEHVEAEQAFRSFIRQHATTPPLPVHHKRRIIEKAMQPPRSASGRSRLVIHLRDVAIGMVAAAAVLFLFFGPFSPWSAGDDFTQKFVQEASMVYGTYRTQDMPLEVVSADDKMVTQWFNHRMGYRLKVPCITDKATKLLGGRLCRLLDRKSATLMYKRNGVDILLFAFKGPRFSLPAKHMVRTQNRLYYIQTVAGHPVAMWQRGDMTYSIVGDIDRNDLLQVAGTISYR